MKSKLSGKYKRSDVAANKVPGRAGLAALRRSVTDRRATPQMDALDAAALINLRRDYGSA